MKTVSKPSNEMHHPDVRELYDWLNTSVDRQKNFDEAISTAGSHKVPELQDIHCLADWFNFLDSLQQWIPSESVDANEMFNRFSILYFVLDQPSVLPYQNPITPNSAQQLSLVSRWIIHFNVAFGTFMDTPASLTPEILAASSFSYKCTVADCCTVPFAALAICFAGLEIIVNFLVSLAYTGNILLTSSVRGHFRNKISSRC